MNANALDLDRLGSASDTAMQFVDVLSMRCIVPCWPQLGLSNGLDVEWVLARCRRIASTAYDWPDLLIGPVGLIDAVDAMLSEAEALFGGDAAATLRRLQVCGYRARPDALGLEYRWHRALSLAADGAADGQPWLDGRMTAILGAWSKLDHEAMYLDERPFRDLDEWDAAKSARYEEVVGPGYTPVSLAGDAMARLALMGALSELRGAISAADFEAFVAWASRRTSVLDLLRGRKMPVLDCEADRPAPNGVADSHGQRTR